MEAVRRAIEAYGRQGLDGVLRYLAVTEATGPAHVPPEEAGTQAFAAELRGRLCSGPGPLAGERTSDNRRLKQAPRVSDRTRTGDHLDHNQELYQLSYAHRELPLQSSGPGATCGTVTG